MNESKSGDSSLHDWFKKSRSSDGTPGWVQLGGKYAGKPCAKQPGQTTKPKCGSSKMKRNLDDEEEQRAFDRKQRKDKNPNRKGKAINVATEETKKDHEFSMARSELKTLKNAAKRLEKKMGKNGEGELKAWVQSKITKAADYIDTAADYVTNEEAGEKDACYKKVKKRYKVWPSAYASGALVKCRKKGAANWGNKSESYEFSNWRDDFQATEYEFFDIVEPEPIKGGQQIDEKCWDGYTQKGMKKKGKKVVPNCVKKEGYAPGDVDQKVGAVTAIPKKEQDDAKARLLAKAKAKREKMKEEKEESNIGGGNLQKLSKKAAKRIDYDVDGDVDSQDKVEKSKGEYGEELPTPFGKFRTGDSKKIKVKKEEFSDWRNELDESIMPAAIDPKVHRQQQRAAKVRNLAKKGATEGERAAAERKTKGPKMFGEDWQSVNKKDKTDGMSPAAVKAYRRENPGSKLKTAVTGDPKPGSKDAKRRSSYCSRSEGQKEMHNIDCSKTPDKAICKARRRWKC